MRNRVFSLILSVVITGGILWLLFASGFLSLLPDLLNDTPPKVGRDNQVLKTPVKSLSSPSPSPTMTSVPKIGPWTDWQAPDFMLKTLSGTTEQLSDHQGHIVLLNFWTSWCIPCKEEMPDIQNIYERYQDQGFIVLGINITALDERSEAERFVDELGLTFPILLDEDGNVSDGLYRVISIPMSFFIDSEGKIYSVQVGAVPKEKIEQLVRELLPE